MKCAGQGRRGGVSEREDVMDEANWVDALLGLHELSGVDFSEQSIDTWGGHFEDCQVMNFILDGRVLSAIEDPDDGYRSMLKEIREVDIAVSNTFAPIVVLGSLRTKGQYSGEDEVVEFRDIENVKLVMEVGTEDIDDYYPGFVARFNPENMSVNEK